MVKNKTSQILSDIAEFEDEDKTSIGRIKTSLHERGFGVLMAVFCLPLILPIPAPPGYTTLFSIPLFILSVQMIWGAESPWLPNWITSKEVKTTTLRKLTGKALPLLKWVEKFLHPRLAFISTKMGERIIGLFAFIFCLSIALPIPMTNVPPAFGILVMSLGLLGKDGLVIIVGKIIGIIGLLITSVIIYGIYFGTNELMKNIPDNIKPHVEEIYGPVIDEYIDINEIEK